MKKLRVSLPIQIVHHDHYYHYIREIVFTKEILFW